MQIKEALQKGALLLRQNHNIRPRLESEIVLGYVLAKERIWLHTHYDFVLQKDKIEQFFAIIQKRINNFPLEYITKKVSFFQDEFFVDSGVLIPRPETEILAQKLIALIQENNLKHIAEIGIGSGALSISIAKNCPDIEIVATDISPIALNIAAKNIAHFGLDSRISLIQTSLLDNIDTNFELVFSNPPYIARDYNLPPNVCYEPQEALFGGKNGWEILESIIMICAQKAVPFLACEIGYDQKQHIESLLHQNKYNALFYTDLAGIDRGFLANKI